MSLASFLRVAAFRFPNKPAAIVDNRMVSYSRLNLEAKELSHKLMASGVRPGDRVALHMYNGLDLAVAYFACFNAGAIAVPVNTRMKAPEIEYVIKHSGTSIYLGQSELFQEIDESRPLLPNIKRFVVDGRGLETRSDVVAATESQVVAADHPAVILYTSGSTARPKGVVHTHASVASVARDFNVASDDVVTIVTPMVHSAAFFTLIASVEAAATAVLVARFDPNVVLDAIAEHHGTYMVAMPTMYRALIAAQKARPRDVSSGSYFFAGGDVVPPELQNEFEQSFARPLYEGFGTTESGLVAANWPGAEVRVGSFGRAVANVDVAVVDGQGNPVPVETDGEMIVRSAGNMVGYWNDQLASEKAIINGWFYTGDLVQQDADGYLWFRGRKKEVIVRGGSNISPQEVEAVLYKHVGVREAGVVGRPDVTWGERVVAFVSPRPGRPVTADELTDFVSKRLAAYKTPEEVVFLDELPKSEAGKILRRALREIYTERPDRPFSTAMR
jgi:long-chain acyl-CoA synthetase